MRILMVSDVYFPRINGVSTSIQTFREELTAAGHSVFLIAPSYEEACIDDELVMRVASRGVILDPEDRMMKYRELLRLVPALRSLEIDLIHIQTPFVAHYAGLRIARDLDVPCVTTYHTLFEEYLYHYIPWLPKPLLRWCARSFSLAQCKQVNGIITPSSIIGKLLQSYGVSDPIVTIPTGIKSHKFATGNGSAFRQKLNIADNKKLLLNVSRVAFEKNIGRLLEVLETVLVKQPDAHLVIAGEGPAKQTYIQQAKDMGIMDHVSFVGYLDRETELVDCYHAADVFVFSSCTETQGLVLLEAMAAGTPVVSVAEMGSKEVLVEGKGVLITDGSVEDFAGKVIAVLKNPQTHLELSESAKSYAREWDSNRLAEKMSAYYREIVFEWPAEPISHL